MDAEAFVLTELKRGRNREKIATALFFLTSLSFQGNKIGDQGAAVLSEALKTNATLMSLELYRTRTDDIANLVADRHRVNELVPEVPAWVALAVARLNEVPEHLRWPPSFAECAATLAFGDELLDLVQGRDIRWLSLGGRDWAAAYLLPRAETALRQELQRLADAAKRAREGQSASSSGSRAM